MKDQVVMTYFIRIKLCERHPHTSGLHKSKYCVMPDPFPVERFGKGSAMPDTGLDHRSACSFLTVLSILTAVSSLTVFYPKMVLTVVSTV